MNKIILGLSFNTNRGYSANGQRIVAILLEDGRILMADLERNLQYVLQGCTLTAVNIMHKYDTGETESCYGADRKLILDFAKAEAK